jgi:glutathione synthase/RimK-type ligase-like ATP-grasp enzyme
MARKRVSKKQTVVYKRKDPNYESALVQDVIDYIRDADRRVANGEDAVALYARYAGLNLRSIPWSVIEKVHERLDS